MRIVLIALPYDGMTDPKVSPPLGILYLASVARNRGHKVAILDLNITKDYMKYLQEFNPHIIGISCMSASYGWAKKVTKEIKEVLGKPVILGGTHATALPAETMAGAQCDFLVCGEGEETFSEILQGFEAKPSFGTIGRGLYKQRPLIENLDSIPMPSRDLININDYTRTIGGEKATSIITSRGCYGKCIFCMQDKLWGRKIRYHSVERVMKEVDWIRDNWKINSFLIIDDTLTSNKARFMKICEELKKRNSRWRGWTRADAIDKEIAEAMASSGCTMMCVGIEHFDNGMLKRMGKRTTAAMNEKAIECIKSAGIACRAAVMVGAPGETRQTLKTLEEGILRTKPDDWIISIFVPLPGTEAFEHPDKFGMRLLIDKDYSNCLWMGGDMAGGHCVEYDNLSRDEIVGMRDELYNNLMKLMPPKYYTKEGIK